MTETDRVAGAAGGQRVYFDELAELFAVFAADTDVLYRPALEAALRGLSGRRAVDLGCGSGRFTGLLQEHYDDVLGVDLSEREIVLARQANPTGRYQVRDLLSVNAEGDGLFDLVFSVNTLHHLNSYVRVLPHLRTLLVPGGTALVVDITDPGGWATLDYQVRSAFADAEDSYRHRSRDHRIAAKVLELHLHPAWLEHCLNDRPLTRPEFIAIYGAEFPGAEFAELHPVITAMRWTDQEGQAAR